MGAYGEAVKMGGVLPSYYKNDTLVDDPYGRILVLDIETNELKVELEGGERNDYFFSNPDCITSYSKNGEDFLIINEDIIEITKNRSPEEFYVNEVYKYNLKTKELTRVLIAPKGSETTGGIFDRNGNYFLNIQHPDINNQGIFNKSTLVVIKGIQD
jgi:secreted PhoX family phosphatase